jgi:UDP-glucose 4-epimerase
MPDAAPVLNVCTGVATSITDLAATIGEVVGNPPKINYRPARSGDIRHSLGDPSNMRQVLGMGSMLPLREGLETVLAHADAPR